MKATNIQWDVDDPKDLESLPAEIELPEELGLEDDDAVSDYITDLTGFCHRGFQLEDNDPATHDPEAYMHAKHCPETRRKLSLDASLDELDLSARSYNLLWRNGKTTIGAVSDMTKEELLKIRNMGVKSAHEIISKLAVAGISLREDTPISTDM